MSALKKQFNEVVNSYIEKFCKKHDVDFDFWIGDDNSGMASFNCEYAFSLSDIIFDIETNQKPQLILQWQDDFSEHYFNTGESAIINFNSYCMGLRCDQVNKTC